MICQTLVCRVNYPDGVRNLRQCLIFTCVSIKKLQSSTLSSKLYDGLRSGTWYECAPRSNTKIKCRHFTIHRDRKNRVNSTKSLVFYWKYDNYGSLDQFISFAVSDFVFRVLIVWALLSSSDSSHSTPNIWLGPTREESWWDSAGIVK